MKIYELIASYCDILWPKFKIRSHHCGGREDAAEHSWALTFEILARRRQPQAARVLKPGGQREKWSDRTLIGCDGYWQLLHWMAQICTDRGCGKRVACDAISGSLVTLLMSWATMAKGTVDQEAYLNPNPRRRAGTLFERWSKCHHVP